MYPFPMEKSIEIRTGYQLAPLVSLTYFELSEKEMPVPTISYARGEVRIIDQTQLPLHKTFITIHTKEEMWDAIKQLKIRGAPAIGIGAAFGIYLGIKDFEGDDRDAFPKTLQGVCDFIGSSRPTAVNLFWAIDRIQNLVDSNRDLSVDKLKELILHLSLIHISEPTRPY